MFTRFPQDTLTLGIIFNGLPLGSQGLFPSNIFLQISINLPNIWTSFSDLKRSDEPKCLKGHAEPKDLGNQNGRRPGIEFLKETSPKKPGFLAKPKGLKSLSRDCRRIDFNK